MLGQRLRNEQPPLQPLPLTLEESNDACFTVKDVTGELILPVKEGGVKKLTAKEIDAARSPKGGFTKETLVGWGIPWPPPKGWRQMLIDGQTVPQPGVDGEPASAVRPSACPEAKLLHDVVMSVINAGHGEILNDVDGLHVYYDNHLPTVADVIGGDLPLNFHPAAIRASAVDTPIGAV